MVSWVGLRSASVVFPGPIPLLLGNHFGLNRSLNIKGPSEQSKEDDKDLKTIKSSTTPDPGYHMGK